MRGIERPDLDAAAAGWVAREDRGPLAPEEREALDRWLAQSGRHYGAYARARAVMAWSGRAAALGGEFGGARRRGRRRLWWWTTAAAAMVATLGLWLVGLPGADVRDEAGTLHATGRGQVLRVVLDDGSAMTLDAGTRVRVRFDRQRRRLQLLAGTALFEVARDPSRPFAVTAGDTTATAVGTRFSVSRDADDAPAVEVLVSEGIVDVGRAHDADGGAQLVAGMRVVAVPASPLRVERLDEDDVQRRLLWREGMLAFNGDTLADAVERFRRYGGPAILVDDPGVASRRIVGLYPAHDPAGFARHAALSLGLTVEVRPEGVRLSAAGAHATPAPARASSPGRPQ